MQAFSAISGSHNIFARAREVLAHHQDDAKDGKPLFLLVPGGLVALASVGFMLHSAFAIWVTGTVKQDDGMPDLLLLFLPYFIGIFIFCYGYELYNLPKAIGMTLLAGIAGLAAIAIVICIAALIAALLSGDKKGSLLRAAAASSSGSGGGVSSSGSFTSTYIGPSGQSVTYHSSIGGAQAQRVMNDVLNLGLNVAGNVNINPNASASVRPPRVDACSKCAQPLNPARVVPIETALAHPDQYCPHCCQPYVAAGYGASASS